MPMPAGRGLHLARRHPQQVTRPPPSLQPWLLRQGCSSLRQQLPACYWRSVLRGRVLGAGWTR